MSTESSQEIPPDILENIRVLQLELEDGDITLKGFEKKKASLLAQYNLPLDTELDFEPEPTAAEVTDFLDFLPSPSHSPKESGEFMKGNLPLQESKQTPQIMTSNLQSSPSSNSTIRPPSNNQSSTTDMEYSPSSAPRPLGNHTYNNNNRNTMSPPTRPASMNGYPYQYPTQGTYRPISSQQINPISTSPKPMFRPPLGPNAMNSNFRPPPPYHGHPSNPKSRPSSMDNKSHEFDNPLQAIQKAPSIASISNTSRHRFSLPPSVTPSLFQKGTDKSKYGSSSMTKSFRNFESIPIPTLPSNNTLEELAGRQMLPSVPRDIPFKVIDIQDKKDLGAFENIAEVLRYRASSSPGRMLPAFTQVDVKGKEGNVLTWEKLGARAEKVAMVIKEKSALKMGDRVGLVYQKSETLDFIVALFGCFLAGMVAVPINATEDLAELWFILSISNTHLVLTTEQNLKTLTKTIKARNTEFPKGLDWWPTNDFGSLYPNQISLGKYPNISTPPLAYIEYTKSLNGELKGVAVSHKAIMNNCQSFIASATETIEFTNDQGVTSILPNWDTQGADVLLTYLEHRQQLGLNISVFCSIYNGNHTLFAGANIMETPAAWIYIVTKYKVTIALASYSGAYFAAKYFQKNNKQVMSFSKKTPPNLSSIRLLLIDALIVQPEVNEFIATKLIGPLSTKSESDALQVITPIASLPEHGGLIIGFRDYLNLQKQSAPQVDGTFSPGTSRDIWECTLDAEALRMKKVVVLSSRLNQSEIQNEPGTLRVSSHGFPLPNSTIAIVDPDTSLFCPPETIGEIWIDSPSVPDGFWGIPSLTDSIYHANPILIHSDTLVPEKYGKLFIRTGVLGTMIGGRLVILGTYEDCVRQQRVGGSSNVLEIHIGSDIINTVARRAKVDACTLFEINLNQQCLPVLAMETNAANDELPKIAQNVYTILNAHHGLRLYAIVITKKQTLPRYLKDGNFYIHHLMTKHRFLSGQLAASYIKLNVDNTVLGVGGLDNEYNSIWKTYLGSYDKALFMNIIPPRSRPQHTGIDLVRTVIDERTGYDISKFANIVDMMIWRTSLFPEENAFVSVSQNSNSISTKPYSWRKINNHIATLANYLVKKKGLRPGTKVLILVPFGVDLVISIYACLVTGIIPLLLQPPDPNKSLNTIQEKAASIIRAIHDLNLTYILTNSHSDDILRNKNVQSAIKLALINSKSSMTKLPEQINIEKCPRYNKMLGKESGFFVDPKWIMDRKRPAIILKNLLDDPGRPEYTVLGHDTLLAQCRAQKVTCQIKFQKPLIVNGFDGYESIGFLHSIFCGVYVGCTTVLMAESDIYTSSSSYFELVSRNKSINICGSYSLFDFLMSKTEPQEQRRIDLRSIQNYMITAYGRTKPLHYDRISRFLSLSGVSREFISTVYTHPLNPMIATRSYIMVEPIPLVVELKWLQQGIVRPVVPRDDIHSVLLHDSGIVPNNTMIAIVNPETKTICPSHAIGEIWVFSECNVRGIYGMDDASYINKFEATINGTDPRNKYMRTGDLGFLWNVQRKTMGAQISVEEGQCLYVLGRMDEVISHNNMIYFPMDIEETVERCHPDLIPEGSYAIKSDKEVIIIATVKPNSTMIPSLACLIVNAVLECHELVVHTVVLANRDQIPRKINGEKRRKHVLSLYKQKKISAIQVSQIKNQNQPVLLPQWTPAPNKLIDSDNMSVYSFGQRSFSKFDVDNTSIHRLSALPSAKSQNSDGLDSTKGTNL